MNYPELNAVAHVWQLEGEEWRDIANYVGRYQVSDKGRIRSVSRPKTGRNQVVEFTFNTEGRILKANNDSRGYPQISLSQPKRVARVHRIVAETFLAPPSDEVVEECRLAGTKVFVNHIDKNKGNARPSNLEWCSPKYNVDHSEPELAEGRKKISGSRNYSSVLEEEDVLKILEMLREGVSQEKVGAIFGVKQITISNIWTGRSWAHFTGIPWTARTRKARRQAKAVSNS